MNIHCLSSWSAKGTGSGNFTIKHIEVLPGQFRKTTTEITLSEHNDTTKPMPQICALTIGKARMLTYASYFCCNCDCNSAAQQPDEYIRASTNKIYNI